jgi:glycosyltransferase 2 family protein
MSSNKKHVITLVKWTLFCVVLFFVGREALSIWRAGDFGNLHVDWMWVLLSTLCYFVGWLPSVWFWRSYMKSLGCEPSWLATIRAYYCGHLGKYVPGKATVLVIRAGLLKSENVPIKVAAIGATLESLGVMAVGLGVTVSLAAWTLPAQAWSVFPGWFEIFRTTAWLGPVIVAAGAVVVIPSCAAVLTKIANRLALKEVAAVESSSLAAIGVEEADNTDTIDSADSDPGNTKRLLILGTLSFIPAWFMHGLSLGCIVIATGGEASWSNSLMWMGVVSGATAIGFLVLFAPGGLGVREGLIIAALSASTGKPEAIAIAALLRIAWFATELTSSAVLYATGRKQDA